MSEFSEQMIWAISKKIEADEAAQRIIKKASGKDHKALARLSKLVGADVASVLQSYIKADSDGFLSPEAAAEAILPALRAGHDTINAAGIEIQNAINDGLGIALRATGADFDSDRASGIVEKIASDKLENTLWLLRDPVVNFHQHVADSFVQANADVFARAGLQPRIIRTCRARGCEWCQKLARTYAYEDAIGTDVFRRHENCTCTVSFDGRKGKLQDVWTKKFHADTGEVAKAERQRAEREAIERKKSR